MSNDRLSARRSATLLVPPPSASGHGSAPASSDLAFTPKHATVRRFAADSLVAHSGDLVFQLQACDHGLVIQRDQWSDEMRTTHARIAMLIETVDDFERWLDVEPTRFSDPLLHRLLRRRGEELLDGRT